MEETDSGKDSPLLAKLEDVHIILRKESQNRVVDDKVYLMYDCLANTLHSLLSRKQAQRHGIEGTSDDTYSSSFENCTSRENIQDNVVDLLSKHSKQFQSVFVLLVEDIPVEALPNNPSGNKDHEKRLEDFYQKVILDCKRGSTYHAYMKLCIYAAATCINTPIYILSKNETGHLQWSYFKPLFRYDGQPKNVISYVTMYMSSEKAFHKIESNDMSAPKPKTTGLVAMYLTILEDMPAITIAVPDELRRLKAEYRSTLCKTVSREIVLECRYIEKLVQLIAG